VELVTKIKLVSMVARHLLLCEESEKMKLGLWVDTSVGTYRVFTTVAGITAIIAMISAKNISVIGSATLPNSNIVHSGADRREQQFIKLSREET